MCQLLYQLSFDIEVHSEADIILCILYYSNQYDKLQGNVGEVQLFTDMSVDILHLPEYQWWSDILKTGDVDLIMQSLLEHGIKPGHKDENRVKLVLNGHFNFPNSTNKRNQSSDEYNLSKPFFLSVVF